MNGNVIRTITIRGTSEGLDKVTGDLNKLAAAQTNIAVVSEQSAKGMLSLEQKWKRATLALDETARAQDRMARATKLADDAVKQGVATQEQANRHLELVNQRYNTASQSTQKFTQQTGLARHELINLGRQAQDVGVSLVSGQSPFMVLAQQGSQIADVFISSGKSVGSFFGQAVGWAGRFAVSAAGVVTGITAIGGAALYMGASFAAAQREIDKVLSGVGAASGATRGGINRIGEGAAGGGLSIAAAREAATAFAATGKIYEQNINTATNVTREFAQAMGIDAADATKQLAAALVDPAKGALELNKSIRFLDADTLKYITTLQSMGQLQQAQNALLIAALPALARQAEQVGLLTRMWNEATRQLSLYFDQLTKQSARGFERVTGIETGGFTDQERLAGVRQTQQQLRAVPTEGLGPRALQALAEAAREADKEVERLEKRLADLNKQTEAGRFAQMSLEAQAFGQSLDQTGVKIETLTAGLAKIAQYQAARLNQGLALDPALERQAQIGNVILAQTLQQQQAEQTKARVIADNAMQYQNVSTSAAQTLVQLQAQLGVAQAVTGAAEIQAQHHATIVSILGTENTSLVTQEQLTSAIAIADAQRVNSIALANTQATRMLKSLQNEGELIRASSDYEKDSIKARQTYQKLLDDHVDSEKARAVAMQQLSNARAEMSKREEEVSNQATAAADARVVAYQRAGQAAEDEAIHLNVLAERIMNAAREFAKFVPFGTSGLYDPTPALGAFQYMSKQGGASQFNPGGYTFQIAPPPLPYPQQLQQTFDRLVAGSTFGNQAGVGLSKAISTLLPGGFQHQQGEDWSAPMGFDQVKFGLLSRAIGTLPEQQQIAPLQQLLGEVQKTPQSLESIEVIKQLTDRLTQLTTATEENTAATHSMTDVLSPYYSSDPRQTHLGFRAFAGGGIMTQFGELPLKHYAGGGMATSPQVSVFGEGSTPEAYVPVPSGRIPVEIKQPANSNQRPVQVTINVHGNADAGTIAALKTTAFQQAQAMRRVIG